MALSIQQRQTLSQQLVITQRLQQAIQLLQLNHVELVQAVQNEMLENPTLEEIPGTVSHEVSDAERRVQEGVSQSAQDTVEQNNGNAEGNIDWQKYLEQQGDQGSAFRNAAGPSRYDDLPPIETNLVADASLSEHLMWQLGMQSCTDDERTAAVAIIHSLDHRGWLDMGVEQVAVESGVSDLDAVEGALLIIQSLDPIGCGTSGLIECLIVQAQHHWPEDPFIQRILTDHIPDLEVRNYPAIAKALELQMEDVVEYHKMLQVLEPWPARPFSSTNHQYITPDIEVVKVGEEWQIVQNEDGLPRLRVSPYYRQVLSGPASTKEDKQYIKERMDSADFLIKSIFKRQRTIHKVVESIMRRQRGFFDQGPELLSPMVLRDVADEIGVHESTVSRVTTNKYLQCPHGIFELKYFFNAGLSRSGAGDIANEAVKQHIKRLVADEDVKKPLSDSALGKLLLQKHGIKIARRTVAKYREQLGILPSSQRKRMF